MSKQDGLGKCFAEGGRRDETEAALRYLRENLSPEVFRELRFKSRKLTMHGAELIVRGWEEKK